MARIMRVVLIISDFSRMTCHMGQALSLQNSSAFMDNSIMECWRGKEGSGKMGSLSKVRTIRVRERREISMGISARIVVDSNKTDIMEKALSCWKIICSTRAHSKMVSLAAEESWPSRVAVDIKVHSRTVSTKVMANSHGKTGILTEVNTLLASTMVLAC